jgi:hypothetical protein
MLEFLQTQNIKVNNQSSSYLLDLNDSASLILMNVASANTVTIPNDSNVDFLIGTKVYVIQSGVGLTSIASQLGVTIYSQNNILDLAGQSNM